MFNNLSNILFKKNKTKKKENLKLQENDNKVINNDIKENPDDHSKEIKSNLIFKTQDQRFNQILMTRDFIDDKYIALQLYAQTEEEQENEFDFSQLNKYVAIIIDFIEQKIKEGIVISFDDKLYLKTKKTIKDSHKRKLFSIDVLKKITENNIAFKIKNLNINIKSLNNYRIYKYIIDNLSSTIIELLDNYYNIKFNNFILLKIKDSYATVISQKFMTYNHEIRINKALSWKESPIEQYALKKTIKQNNEKNKVTIKQDNIKNKLKASIKYKKDSINQEKIEQKKLEDDIDENQKDFKGIFQDVMDTIENIPIDNNMMEKNKHFKKE